ncbi:MarR family transcriptional regulator [Helicobacter sp. 11S02596-1]|uniref:MarR family winged helix-turn-helix transcriptional regulator n=1 Tax=Helicobacter sp. 11S02596-1 TaxID=1476194 RepID=UPI000BA5BC88|nr:MarR family transcriptional regulator [Helicobacter sp. 11S02596-1]PAF42863.1 hypothetical protein BJI48_06310 [Helicobacter sp. 11S02596-1]
MQEQECQPIAISIILASRQIRNYFSQKLRPFNIGFEQIGILAILEQQSPLNITELSHIILKDKATISRTIESLCKKNFVKKIQNKEDNRITKISITPKGIKKLAVIKQNKEMIVDVFFQNISDAEKKEFLRILEKIIGALN